GGRGFPRAVAVRAHPAADVLAAPVRGDVRFTGSGAGTAAAAPMGAGDHGLVGERARGIWRGAGADVWIGTRRCCRGETCLALRPNVGRHKCRPYGRQTIRDSTTVLPPGAP